MTHEDSTVELMDRLAERDRRRAAFAGTVSHDLKTPLNAIIGFTSVLLADAGQLGPDQQRQLRLVYESAQALLGRINDLLLLYRLEADRVEMNRAPIMPAELLMQLAGTHRPAAVEQGGDLTLDLAQAPSRIDLDPQLIRAALGQLIGNAVRFGGGGAVRLDVRAEPATDPDRTRVVFGVENGVGGLQAEAAEKLPAALEPGRAYLDQTFDGLGLGLALAREAARLMGGAIHLRDRAGAPARFELVLDLPAEAVETG